MSATFFNILQTTRHILYVNNSVLLKNCITLTSFVELVPNHQVTTVRHSRRPHWAYSRVFRQIRGGGRPVPEGKVIPQGRLYGWRPVYPEDGKYTTKALPIIKLGGRDPKTGRVVVSTIGGGHRKTFRWVDYKRQPLENGSVLEEKVFKIIEDPVRTAKIALVASGDHKRWIIASSSTKVGDIVRTSGEIPRIPVRPVDGDAYPVGALPQGTLIHMIEGFVGKGGMFCRAAGTSAQYLRRIDDKCLVQLPSKQQILLDEKCMVVVGKTSNEEHYKEQIGSPNELRRRGKRPRSGLFHRKDGYCGRKIHPPKSIKEMILEKEEKPEIYQLSID